MDAVSQSAAEAVFRVEGKRVFTSEHATGPWDPRMQHGGAPSALVTWAAETLSTPCPMRIARISVDLMRPVPIAELNLESEIIREGRKIQLCVIRLLADGVEVVRASVLKVRKQDVMLPDGVEAEKPLDVAGPDQGREEHPGGNKFMAGITIHAVKGGFMTPSPSAIWFRCHRPIVEGAPLSQSVRVAAASDCSNAVSSVLDFRKWLFINADLTIHMAREPVGEWILLNGEMTLGPDGGGIAVSRLADMQGYFGRAVQSLVVEPR